MPVTIFIVGLGMLIMVLIACVAYWPDKCKVTRSAEIKIPSEFL